VAGEGSAVDPLRAKRELAARGYTRMLTEGGPRLLAQFAAAGALDELCLTTSPRLAAGTAERVMHGPGLPVPQELALTSLLEDAGFLFARYQRA
jgi:riboflavin biosynthesis pyrimidine reductase